MGSKLNVLWKNLRNDLIYFYQSGFYNHGRDSAGKCIILASNATLTTTPIISSFFDTPILFGKDFFYACHERFTLAEFTDYCVYNKWENLLIFKNFEVMDFIGKFGSSDIKYSEVNFP